MPLMKVSISKWAHVWYRQCCHRVTLSHFFCYKVTKVTILAYACGVCCLCSLKMGGRNIISPSARLLFHRSWTGDLRRIASSSAASRRSAGHCSWLQLPTSAVQTRADPTNRSRTSAPRLVSPCVASFRFALRRLVSSTPCPLPVIIVVQCFQIHDTAMRGFVLREDFAKVNNLDFNQCTSLLYYES